MGRDGRDTALRQRRSAVGKPQAIADRQQAPAETASRNQRPRGGTERTSSRRGEAADEVPDAGEPKQGFDGEEDHGRRGGALERAEAADRTMKDIM